MSLAETTERLRARVGEDCGIPKVIKFDFGGDGVIRIDGASKPNTVDNTDGPADCTISVSLSDFQDMGTGKLNPQMAFMMGKLKIAGDMSIALQLGKILG
jgi:putative sterol carrier protein